VNGTTSLRIDSIPALWILLTTRDQVKAYDVLVPTLRWHVLPVCERPAARMTRMSCRSPDRSPPARAAATTWTRIQAVHFLPESAVVA